MRFALAADGGASPPTADPLEPAEALAWFRSRAPLSHEQWQRLDDDARKRAFTVANVTSLRVIDHVWTALERALADGTTFEDFQRSIGDELTTAWGRPNSGRLETVFIDNVQSAYAAGRWTQLTAPDVVDARPYWQFSAVLDARTSDICLPLGQTIRAASDPWWNTHYPPLHHRCFPPGTMVRTSAGDRAIETIRVGDLVLTHRNRWRAVTATIASASPQTLTQVRLESGRHVVATANHPALTDRGWVEFSRLRRGERLFHAGEATGQGRVVVEHDWLEPGAYERSKACGRHAPAILRHFHDHADFGQVAVVGTSSVRAISATVYNLSVADDESYVASGFVVHNCRSSVVSLTPEEAHAEGGVQTHPDHGTRPQDGWGGPPRLGDWTPDLTDTPAPLREVHVERSGASRFSVRPP